MATTTKPTINTYVSDMLALERHILIPIEHQAEDKSVAAAAHARRVFEEAQATTRAHIEALEKRLDELGGHAGSPVKSSVASALGVAAAALGDVRKTEVSKYLRDDYAALCLASAAYTMLHTTALAMGDTTTASLAKRHLADEATLVMRLSSTLPAVVLKELSDEGVAVDPSVLAEIERNVERAWQEGGERSS